jgi:hypothetical protein
MRVNIFRKLVLMWMLLWLPMAGAMAAVMPLSSPLRVEAVMSVQPAAENGDAADGMAMPCHAAPDSSTPTNSCTQCVLCHLAGALSIGAMPVVPMVAPTHRYEPALLIAPPSFVPDPAVPPPRAALA